VIRHVVQPGECMSKIAHRYGYRDANALFQAPENASLREQRDNPNVLRAGDVVAIPERDAPSHAVNTGEPAAFTVLRPRARLRLRLLDADHRPMSGKRYRLELGAVVKSGTTRGDGYVEEDVGVHHEAGTLFVWLEDGDRPHLALPVQIGALDPVSEDTGVLQRLRQLGFRLPDTPSAEELRGAIEAFQRKHRLETTGEANDATRRKLEELHDHR
jgi:hypothetical protein